MTKDNYFIDFIELNNLNIRIKFIVVCLGKDKIAFSIKKLIQAILQY